MPTVLVEAERSCAPQIRAREQPESLGRTPFHLADFLLGADALDPGLAVGAPVADRVEDFLEVVHARRPLAMDAKLVHFIR